MVLKTTRTSANGQLYLVPTPIGNLQDMTYRAVEVLQQVDIIAVEDTRVSQVLFNHYQIKPKKIIVYHKFNEKKQSIALLEHLENGLQVAIITDAGSPGISDPCQIMVQSAIENGINVIALPGPTALIPALSASGLNTAHFLFAGFLSNKNRERKQLINAIKSLPVTLIFYTTPHDLYNDLEYLTKELGNRRITVARELTKLYETYYRGYIQDLFSEKQIIQKGEYVLIVEGNPIKQSNLPEAFKELRRQIKEGIEPKEAMHLISTEYDVSKKELYNYLLSLKKK